MKVQSSLVLALTITTLTACTHVSQVVHQIPIDVAQNNSTIKIKDSRPEAEKIFSIRSSLTTNCEFAIYDLGDGNTNPSRMEILSLELNKNPPAALKGQEIEIEHFKIINNVQMAIRRTSPFMGPVTIDSLCKAGPEVEGGVDQISNPEYLPQLTLLISAKVNGTQVRAKHIQIYKAEIAPAITQGLAALISKFKSTIAP